MRLSSLLGGPAAIGELVHSQTDANSHGIESEGMVSKMCIPTTNTGMFELIERRVPKQKLIGGEGNGWKVAREGPMHGTRAPQQAAPGASKIA